MSQKSFNYLNNETFNETFEENLQEGQSSEVSGNMLLSSNNESFLNLNINHEQPNTNSKIRIRAVLRDSAKLKIFGDIFIENAAKNADADFDVKVIILGDHAKATVLPKLRIDTKDVKRAKHSVLIKKISEKDLYFFESRGVAKEKAEEVIIKGFLGIQEESQETE